MTDAATFSTTATVPSPPPIVFDVGSENCPQFGLPGKAVFSVDEAKHALNPLQHLPIVGMIYREATGESLPPPLAILGSVAMGAIFGGPIGILGSVITNFIEEMVRLGPDTSRPSAPEGMSATGSEAGVQPVTPGTVTEPGGYTTLATVLPDFLGGGDHDSPSAQVRLALDSYAGTMMGHG